MTAGSGKVDTAFLAQIAGTLPAVYRPEVTIRKNDPRSHAMIRDGEVLSHAATLAYECVFSELIV